MLVRIHYRHGHAVSQPVEVQVDPPSRTETDIEIARRIASRFVGMGAQRGISVSTGNYESLVARVEAWLVRMGRAALERGQTSEVIEYAAIDERSVAVPQGSRSVPVRPPPSELPEELGNTRPSTDLWDDSGG